MREQGALRNRSLLIDTRNGEPLLTRHVTKALKDFLVVRDENLRNISAMSLRDSYAKMMIQEYHCGRIFPQYSKSKISRFSE